MGASSASIQVGFALSVDGSITAQPLACNRSAASSIVRSVLPGGAELSVLAVIQRNVRNDSMPLAGPTELPIRVAAFEPFLALSLTRMRAIRSLRKLRS